jgi:hypothetical protein
MYIGTYLYEALESGHSLIIHYPVFVPESVTKAQHEVGVGNVFSSHTLECGPQHSSSSGQ